GFDRARYRRGSTAAFDRPGTPLAVSSVYPAAEDVAALLNSLHDSGVPGPSYPAAGQRVAYLFGSSAKLYERDPELRAVIPPELYGRGPGLATRLAQHDSAAALLHGDLTPSNILDGGARRGLVAIDPAPCLGSPQRRAWTQSGCSTGAWHSPP